MPDTPPSNSGLSPAPSAEAMIRHYAGRIMRLMDEQDGHRDTIKELGADIAEIKKEAKGNGFDAPILMGVIKEWRRRQADVDDFEEAESLWDTYWNAMMQGEEEDE